MQTRLEESRQSLCGTRSTVKLSSAMDALCPRWKLYILPAYGVEVRSTYVYALYVVQLSRSRRVTE